MAQTAGSVVIQRGCLGEEGETVKNVRWNLLRASLLTVALVATSGIALGHAISIGYENAGPGAVNIWLGTYAHGGHHLEGSLELTGVMGTVFGPLTLPYTTLTPDGIANKPAGLVDGVTNFFAAGAQDGTDPLVGFNPFDGTVSALNPSGFLLPEDHWQGVLFAGLSPGFYQFNYIPILNPSAEWTPYNQSLNGIFELTGAIVNPNPIPEPATFSMLVIGLVGAGLLARRRTAR